MDDSIRDFIAKAVDKIESYQWGGENMNYCPECYNNPFTGHMPGCELKSLIDEGRAIMQEHDIKRVDED